MLAQADVDFAGVQGVLGANSPAQQMPTLSKEDYEQMMEYSVQYAAAIQLQQQHYASLNNNSGATTTALANQGFGFDGGNAAMSQGAASKSTADVRDEECAALIPHDPYRRYVGVISNFKDDRGFGWIKCKESVRVYGKDIFIHRGEVGKDLDKRKQRMYIKLKD